MGRRKVGQFLTDDVNIQLVVGGARKINARRAGKDASNGNILLFLKATTRCLNHVFDLRAIPLLLKLNHY